MLRLKKIAASIAIFGVGASAPLPSVAQGIFDIGAVGGLTSYARAGQAAYRSGDYMTALRLLEPIAEACGSIQDKAGISPEQLLAAGCIPFAANYLGMMYQRGLGVPQDRSTARSFFDLFTELTVDGSIIVLSPVVIYQAADGGVADSSATPPGGSAAAPK